MLREVELGGRAGVDLRIGDGHVLEIGAGLASRRGETEIHGEGGALLPGLHDHHVHLLAQAAAMRSVRAGPPEVRDPAGLAEVLRAAPPGPVRAVGYHESVAGLLDRHDLDRLAPGRAVRLQHRGGALWMLSSAALRELALEPAEHVEGLERDGRGEPTGRLFRLDAWLRAREPSAAERPPELSELGTMLASFGVTGATDATPGNDPSTSALFARARTSGALPQRLRLMGGPELSDGERKILLDERALPALDALVTDIAEAHESDRSVAIHCVTRAEIVLAAAALTEAGVRRGDRLEHASVAPPEIVELVAPLGVTVVTQPIFLRDRGDAYRLDVDPGERPWLYRCRGWLEAGVRLGAGTDAPFGDLDPWRSMQAAVDRRTTSGASIGPGEALDPERALALFTTPPDDPGGAPRRVEVGAPADLCLLDRAWRAAREELSSANVRATIVAGHVTWRRS